MTVALVVTAVLGLAVGVWLGMPGRYTQTHADIEKIIESGGARRRRARRVFTPLAWMQRKAGAKSGPARGRRQARGRRRSGFSLESPDEK